MSEGAIMGVVFGTLLLLNIISLLCFKFTKIGKYFSDDFYDNKQDAIIATICMLLCGICFWFVVLFVRIKYGKVWNKDKNNIE